eukprot:CAMPEP_0181204986 /NCGR_PEP_ID=MMETSP1096-20121128/20229_1 /TAXON_ID=156174 ORGANISM="Chrysochromulina ericina, Strain CCMP281" /NCGR_SAMPLE_ID=MMETSP1096 /ASSEMBLY_ACC=CAM_ASM_000453 /LENGTH=57 /DNA_ID=CAMNT_0023295725 /DNA_START=161 /DNA_END=334 /DNA_ORIENTATION=-
MDPSGCTHDGDSHRGLFETHNAHAGRVWGARGGKGGLLSADDVAPASMYRTDDMHHA